MKIRTGMMPPSGARRPERAALDAFASDLEARLDKAALPGAGLDTPALHRLNRTEYANAIRDLLALDVDVAVLLPADGSSEGFDNIADALSVSPSLIQGYVSAAMKISRRAVGDRTLAPSQVTYPAPRRAGAGPAHRRPAARHARRHAGSPHVPARCRVRVQRPGGVGFGGGGGGAAVDVTLDGEKIATTTPRSFRAATSPPVRTRSARRSSIAVRAAGVDEVYSDFRINSAFTPAGGIQTVVDHRARSRPPARATRRAAAASSPAGRRSAAEETACARQIVTTLARRAYRGPLQPDEVETLMGFYQQGRDGRRLRNRHPAGAGAHPRRAGVPVPRRRGAARRGRRRGVSPQRPRPRVAPVVLPLEQHPRRRTARRRPSRAGCAIRRCSSSRSSACSPTRRRRRSTSNFAGQWLYLRDLANVQTSAKDFDDNLRQAFRRETEMLFEQHRPRGPQPDRPARRRLHVRRRAAGAALRHPEHPRQLLPPRAAAGRQPAPRPARAGQHADGDVGGDPDVARVARQVDSREPARHAGADAAAGRRNEPREGSRRPSRPTSLRQRLEAHRANPVCASCHRIMDPIGFALENFDLVGGVARARRPARRSIHRASWSTARRSTGPADLRAGAAEPVGRVRDDRHRKAADLRAGPAGALLRHADGARDRPARGAERLSLLVAGPRRRRERAVSDENEEVLGARSMAFLTKKHLSRRTFLHGVGVTLALPLLESMVPAGTPLAQTAARPAGRGSAASTSRTARSWTSGRRRRKATSFELTRDPAAAQAVPRPGEHHQRSEPPAGLRQRLATANHNRSAATFLSGAHAEAGAAGRISASRSTSSPRRRSARTRRCPRSS